MLAGGHAYFCVVQRRTGFISQDDLLDPHLTVCEMWSSPMTSRSPPVDRQGEAMYVEPDVAVERGIEAAGFRARRRTRCRLYI
jgi:hypothetical protein